MTNFLQKIKPTEISTLTHDHSVLQLQPDKLAYYLVDSIKILKTASLENKKSLEQINKTTTQSNDILNAYVVPKKKKKHARLPPRDPMTLEMYTFLMSIKRQKHEKSVTYSRFRVVLTLLFFFGLRLNEIRLLRENDIILAMSKKQLDIYQSKTNKFRTIPISPKVYSVLKDLKKDFQTIFHKNEFLGGENSAYANSNFIHFFNNRLKTHLGSDASTISSHSARINYVTRLLKNNAVNVVADLVGHSAVTNTMKYNRNQISKDKHCSLTDALFDFDD